MIHARRTALGVVGLAAVLTIGSLTGVSAKQPDFATLLSQAYEAMHSEPVKGYYDGPFNMAFYARFSGWLNQCTQQTGQSLGDLDMLLTLGGRGSVEGVRFEPQSGLTECFASLVKKEEFPRPPVPSLVVPVSIRITKQ